MRTRAARKLNPMAETRMLVDKDAPVLLHDDDDDDDDDDGG